MNPNVLRGFCAECDWYICMIGNKPMHEIMDSDMGSCRNPTKCNDEKIVPIWYLSAKQIRTIDESKEFKKWHDKFRGNLSKGMGIHFFLSNEPFLVAKILKETGDN